MSRVKISAPNAAYDGKVGDLQFSKGVYEGEAPDAIVNYCRATGYDVVELEHAKPAAKQAEEPAQDSVADETAEPKKAPAKKAPAKKAPAKAVADDKNGASS